MSDQKTIATPLFAEDFEAAVRCWSAAAAAWVDEVALGFVDARDLAPSPLERLGVGLFHHLRRDRALPSRDVDPTEGARLARRLLRLADAPVELRLAEAWARTTPDAERGPLPAAGTLLIALPAQQVRVGEDGALWAWCERCGADPAPLASLLGALRDGRW